MENIVLRPGPNDAGKRLDRILRVRFPDAGLGALFAALRRGSVRVNGKRVSPDYRVAEEDCITFRRAAPFPDEGPKAASAGGEAASAEAEVFLKPCVLFEDGDFIVFNKPWGMLCHGEDSLDSRVKVWLARKLPPSLAFKPGPLHRLDRNTTGVVFFSKSIAGARSFSCALAEGRTEKKYYALLRGHLDGPALWEDSLVRGPRRVSFKAAQGEGKAAVSLVRPLAAAGGAGQAACTLCEIIIPTGRTHQIRAQAAAHGHPLAGDRKYGGSPLRGSPHGGAYILHAAEVTLPQEGPAPAAGGQAAAGEKTPAACSRRLTVKAPLPPLSLAFLEELFGKKIRRVLG